VGIEVVDAGELVAWLEAGAVGWGVACDAEDVDGAGVHFGNEAGGEQGVQAELGVGVGGDGEGAGESLAVVGEGEGERAIEVERGLVDDLFPGGVIDLVEAGDDVTGGEAVAGGGRVEGDVIEDGRAGEVLVYFVMEVGDQEEKEEGEDEVGEGAGDGDEETLPAGLGVEVVGSGGVGFGSMFAGKFDVAAEGKERDAVVGATVLEAEEAGAKADGEGLDADAAELAYEEMAELMDEHHDAENDDEFDDDEEEMHGSGNRPLRCG
jgi:hypothetical protein